MLNQVNVNINKKEYTYFWYMNLFLHILYFLLILGVAIVNIKYVHYLIVLVHISICGFLMIKFNRFLPGGVTVNEYEKYFIFNASVILLINILIYELGISLDIDKVKNYIDNLNLISHNPLS